MSGSWWFRFAVVLFALLGSAWVLAPNFITTPEGQAPAGVAAFLPNTALNKGLDIVGGLDITLQVGVDEAVLSSVGRDVQTVRDAAEREGIVLTSARKARGQAVLELQIGPETTIEALRAFLSARFPGYTYVGTIDGETGQWHRFEPTDEERAEISQRAVEQAVETLRSRIDATGVKEPNIVRKGTDQINIQLPGEVDPDVARQLIGTTAVLEFYLVDEEFQMAALDQALVAAKAALPEAEYNDDRALNEWLVENGRVPGENRVMWEYETTGGVKARTTPYVLKDRVILTGDDVNDAATSMDQYNQPETILEFKPGGAVIFGDVTGENVGKRFAIVLDGEVRSAPVIRDRIAGGRASISMGSGNIDLAMADARMLAMVLRTGALPAPLNIAEERTVGPQLGADAIAAAVNATLIGSVLVVLYMLLRYKVSGVVANVCLTLNVLCGLSALGLLGATLTLPGICGIALTVGMAVDANIIIYERIREELAIGKSVGAALVSGYDNAFSAVIDSNLTTAIAGVVLYSYGTGPIKGFAVTLLIGIASTLFTAIFVSRTLMDLAVRRVSARALL
jgi:protein-export membrane protein SecD